MCEQVLPQHHCWPNGMLNRLEDAAKVALETVYAVLAQEPSMLGVSFVCFSDADYDIYVEAFGML